jgi:4a-hydroxytetrahydrobiopterin dehydratase
VEEKPKKLTDEEVKQRLTKLKGWKVDKAKLTGFPAITKTFHFKDFKESLSFVNKVGEIAENYGHHPEISIFMYNKVRIDIFTHALQGLSEWDFELAELIDRIS